MFFYDRYVKPSNLDLIVICLVIVYHSNINIPYCVMTKPIKGDNYCHIMDIECVVRVRYLRNIDLSSAEVSNYSDKSKKI